MYLEQAQQTLILFFKKGPSFVDIYSLKQQKNLHHQESGSMSGQNHHRRVAMFPLMPLADLK
jgi:hypothetical protein